MDDETAGADRQLGVEAGGKTKERRRVSGDKVIGKIRELIHVRRIIINMERPLALATVTVLFLAWVKSRFVCKSGGSSSPSARLLGRPPVSGGVRGRGNAGRPRRVWS